MTRASDRNPNTMRLEVFSNEVSSYDIQRITVLYNPDKEYTCVGCNADVVTISLAINVLQEMFDIAVKDMTERDVDDIKDITRKAVGGR